MQLTLLRDGTYSVTDIPSTYPAPKPFGHMEEAMKYMQQEFKKRQEGTKS